MSHQPIHYHSPVRILVFVLAAVVFSTVAVKLHQGNTVIGAAAGSYQFLSHGWTGEVKFNDNIAYSRNIIFQDEKESCSVPLGEIIATERHNEVFYVLSVDGYKTYVFALQDGCNEVFMERFPSPVVDFTIRSADKIDIITQEDHRTEVDSYRKESLWILENTFTLDEYRGDIRAFSGGDEPAFVSQDVNNFYVYAGNDLVDSFEKGFNERVIGLDHVDRDHALLATGVFQSSGRINHLNLYLCKFDVGVGCAQVQNEFVLSSAQNVIDFDVD